MQATTMTKIKEVLLRNTAMALLSQPLTTFINTSAIIKTPKGNPMENLNIDFFFVRSISQYSRNFSSLAVSIIKNKSRQKRDFF